MAGIAAVRRRRVWLLAIVTALAAAPAGAAAEKPARPPRIAVTGAYPTGYLGLLARCGLSRDVLLEYQLSNLDLVSRYDLLIVAGAGDLATWAAIDKILARGVNILQDSSSQLTQIQEFLDAMQRKGQEVKWAGFAQKPAKAPFKLAGPGNPLRPFLPAGEVSFDAGFVGLMPPVEAGSTVLAEFGEPEVAGAQVPSGLLFLGRTPLEAGKPAIVLTPRGKAKRVLCGPTIGYDLSLMGADYDHLVLALVRLLTGGRAVQQLDSEAVHLSRKHAAGAAAPPEPAATVCTVPERPDGPGTRAALPAGFTLLEEDPATEFNVSGMVRGAGEILLGHWNSANTLRVRLAPTGITILRTAAGKPQPAVTAAGALPAGTLFAVKVRASRLTVAAGALRASASLQGACRGAVGWRGGLTDVRYQPVEPPTFADDFMRTSDDKGGWEADGGEWHTAIAGSKDLGANPFCYRVTTAGDAPATAVNGYAFWDDYRLSVSVRPEDAGGKVALGAYAQDASSVLLFEAPVPDAGTAKGEFTLVRLQAGKPTLLARCPGALLPGQWYRLRIQVVGDTVSTFVDGVKLLTARDTTFAGGKIALRAEHLSARFDDVSVEPADAPDRNAACALGSSPRAAGAIDVDSWAGPATPWMPDEEIPGLFWHTGVFFSDVALRFSLPALPPGGRTVLLIDGDGRSPDSAWAVAASPAGGALALALRHGGKALSQARLPAGKPVELSLERHGDKVIVRADGRDLLSAAAAGAGGGRLGFRCVGFRPRISAVAISSANVYDYTFDTAPTGWWVGSGEWDITNRWSCTPDWSWFGGVSRLAPAATAAIWHKQPVEGDAVLDFYVAPKMITRLFFPSERMADLNATLCGDGEDPKSGYAFIVAGNGRGAQILKQGKVLAEDKEFRLFTVAHNRWANVRVEKRGRTLRLLVEGRPVLSCDDPDPLPGGYVAVWTRNNGIMLPRITLYAQRVGAKLLSLKASGG